MEQDHSRAQRDSSLSSKRNADQYCDFSSREDGAGPANCSLVLYRDQWDIVLLTLVSAMGHQLSSGADDVGIGTDCL